MLVQGLTLASHLCHLCQTRRSRVDPPQESGVVCAMEKGKIRQPLIWMLASPVEENAKRYLTGRGCVILPSKKPANGAHDFLKTCF